MASSKAGHHENLARKAWRISSSGGNCRIEVCDLMRVQSQAFKKVANLLLLQPASARVYRARMFVEFAGADL